MKLWVHYETNVLLFAINLVFLTIQRLRSTKQIGISGEKLCEISHAEALWSQMSRSRTRLQDFVGINLETADIMQATAVHINFYRLWCCIENLFCKQNAVNINFDCTMNDNHKICVLIYLMVCSLALCITN